MEEREGIIQNIRWLAGANFAVKPIWFLFLLLSTRLLGPEEFGRYMYAIAYVSVISVFCEGGIDILTVRKLASDPASFPSLFAHTSFLKLLSSLLVGLIAMGLTYIGGISGTTRILIVAAIIYTSSYTITTHIRFVFRGFELMKYEAQSILVEKMSVILLCGTVLLFSRKAIAFTFSYAAAYAIATCVTLVLVVRRIGLPRWHIDIRYLWHDIVKPALPYALMSFFMVIYFRSATLMLKTLTGREDLVGFYNAGYRLVEAFFLFPAIIIGPMYPVFSRSGADRLLIKGLLYQATRTIGLMALLVSVPIFVFKEGFTALFFGSDFAEAAPAIGVVILAIIPVGLTTIFGSLVAAIGRQGKANVLISVVTIANLGLHYVLIPRFGLMGAAITTLVTELAMALVCIWVVRDYLADGRYLQLAGKAIAPPVALCVVKALGLLPGSFYISLALALAVIVTAYFLLKLISFADLKKFTTRNNG